MAFPARFLSCKPAAAPSANGMGGTRKNASKTASVGAQISNKSTFLGKQGKTRQNLLSNLLDRVE
jgi:hypothetical protein